MSILTSILRALFDVLLFPFRGLPPIFGLTVVSLLTAIGMLLVFKATSNQTRLAEVKRKIHASLFEIRLFNDDLGAILRAQAHILRHNLSYLRLSLVPMVWIIVPFILVVGQLEFHYAFEGLSVGEKALLKVEMVEEEGDREGAAKPEVALELPEGLRLDSPSVWVPTLQEISWRLVAEEPGSYDVRVAADGATFSKSVEVSDAVVRRSPLRVDRSFWRQLLYPAERPLEKGAPIRTIEVQYPSRSVNLLGWSTYWLWHYFILSIVFAFALRKRMNVTI
jgi:uncharacterized membrane protein (DUF106 family)